MTTRDILYSIESRELGLDKDNNLIARGLLVRGAGGRTTDLHLALTSAKNGLGTAIVATGGAAGNFTIASTAGTSLALKGEDAESNTKTDTCIFEVPAFVGFANGPGGLTVTINAEYAGAGTVGTKTIGLTAYSIAKDGTQTAITVTAPTSVALTTAAKDFVFQLATTGALLGQRILLIPSLVLQETGGSAVLNSYINSVRIG